MSEFCDEMLSLSGGRKTKPLVNTAWEAGFAAGKQNADASLRKLKKAIYARILKEKNNLCDVCADIEMLIEEYEINHQE